MGQIASLLARINSSELSLVLAQDLSPYMHYLCFEMLLDF